MTEQEINNLTTSECQKIIKANSATFFELLVIHEIVFMPDTGNGFGAFNVDIKIVFRDSDPKTAVLKAIIHKKGM